MSLITPPNSAEVVLSTFVDFNAPIKIFAVPLKEFPPIVIAVANAVAVPALPVISVIAKFPLPNMLEPFTDLILVVFINNACFVVSNSSSPAFTLVDVKPLSVLS